MTWKHAQSQMYMFERAVNIHGQVLLCQIGILM